MKYFYAWLLVFCSYSSHAQENVLPRLNGLLILNDGTEIQTGKTFFISGDQLYFGKITYDNKHYTYAIPLDSLKHYEYSHNIRTYHFKKSKTKEGLLKLNRRIGYFVTFMGIATGVMASTTSYMSVGDILAVVGFGAAIASVGVLISYRAIKKTFHYYNFEVAFPYYENEVPINSDSLLDVGN